MAVRSRTTFGGLNTDLPPEVTPSGTADVVLNVTVSGGKLQKRGGFAMLENDVTGAAAVIRNLTTARFNDGDVYVVARASDGYCYHRKSGETSFTKITGGPTADGNDKGWFFLWADRLHFFFRNGGLRWNPDVNSGTAYSAGIGRPTTGVVGTNASGGEKDGKYHVHIAHRNSVTLEEGVASGPQTPPFDCRIATDTGGIATTNWASRLKGGDTGYEWDQAVFYCTNGSTEWIAIGSGVECFSYAAYEDQVIATTQSAEVGLNKADHVNRGHQMMQNRGGLPPGCRIGCLADGAQAIYGLCYTSTTLLGDKLMFSLPMFPTMVPRRVTYSIGNDKQVFVPKPWEGEIHGGFQGVPTDIAYGGGAVILFTPAATYELVKVGGGYRMPRLLHPGKGCAAEGGAVGTPRGVFGVGYRCLMRAAAGGSVDVAENRFSTTLADIPAAYMTTGSSGYYSYRNQVWFAVVKSGDTAAKRILVYDLSEDALMVFEPSCLAATEGITCMTEYAPSNAEPMMLVGTTAGRVLQYPSGYGDENAAGETVGFACRWRGYFGQERAAFDQELRRMTLFCGANTAANVTVGLRAMRASGETVAQATTTLSKSSKAESIIDFATKKDGRFFQVDVTSPATMTTQWTINNLAMVIDRKAR